ncbi:UNVERIFIED_ORG: hypothetical protein ABIB52_004683 [Arthrobacter sp. UYCu721]
MNQNLPEAAHAAETSMEAACPEVHQTHACPGSSESANDDFGHHISGDSFDEGEASAAFHTPRISKRRRERLKVGEHVAFNADGIKGTGTIDAVMPDNSVIWIWSDGGLGRRMLHPGRGTSIQLNGTLESI